ncbi:Rpn family recombination-promoting nuclease/putative transposase [bacterium D16-50]|nr:Rpn family recombination-promoting nuclease/putative transposase [bacterium D16-50]
MHICLHICVVWCFGCSFATSPEENSTRRSRMEIVLPKHDFVFKTLMENSRIRKYFISDVLNIPPEEIKSVRVSNPFLWKRRIRHKQGILDVLLILNNDRKINIELQVRRVKDWDGRTLFYLSKMFTEDLLAGQNYRRLKKCVSISLLDFNIDESPKYHRIYRMRDESGSEFSDLFEIHIVELKKKTDGDGRMDDWIRFFNADTQEDLHMIKTKNPGVQEAINEVEVMSLGKTLRWLYESRLKAIRDQNARDDYVRDEGIIIGETKGKAEGKACALIAQVRCKRNKEVSVEDAAEMLEQEESLIGKIYGLIEVYPQYDDYGIFKLLEFEEKPSADE